MRKVLSAVAKVARAALTAVRSPGASAQRAGEILRGRQASRHFRRASASGQREDWQAAVRAFESIIERHGERATWLYHLGRSYRRLDDLGAAQHSFARAAQLDPRRARYRLWEGHAARRRGAWEAALAAYERAARCHDAGSKEHYWLGVAYEATSRWEPAASAYRRAIAAGMNDVEAHGRLGRVLERCTTPRAVFTPHVGLLVRPEGDWAGAAEAYRQALALDPDDAERHFRLGRCLERLGRFEGARDAFGRAAALQPDVPRHHHRLARAHLSLANLTGGIRADESAHLREHWMRSVGAAPDNRDARRQLVRLNIRLGRWDDASALAWPGEPAVATPPAELASLRSLLAAQAGDIDPSLLTSAIRDRPGPLAQAPAEWWFVVHWRLVSLGYLTLAYEAKDAMAKRAIQELDRPGEGLRFGERLELPKAMHHLGRSHDALSWLDELESSKLSTLQATAIARLRADIDLYQGLTDAHRDLLGVHAGVQPEAERRFSNLIEGARVAIVGPADVPLANGANIDGHDVVIRTQYSPGQLDDHAEFAGSRTDIAYYAMGSATLLRDRIRSALAQGELQMAVLRPSQFPYHGTHLHRPGDLRYMPSEARIPYRAAQFAIQRIIYDVVRYEPQQIGIFGVTFFAARRPYRRGYKQAAGTFESRGLERPLRAFPHCFVSDFIFTKRLAEAGIVAPDKVAAAVLDQSPAEYLAELDRPRPKERPQGDRPLS